MTGWVQTSCQLMVCHPANWQYHWRYRKCSYYFRHHLCQMTRTMMITCATALLRVNWTFVSFPSRLVWVFILNDSFSFPKHWWVDWFFGIYPVFFVIILKVVFGVFFIHLAWICYTYKIITIVGECQSELYGTMTLLRCFLTSKFIIREKMGRELQVSSKWKVVSFRTVMYFTVKFQNRFHFQFPTRGNSASH